MPLEPNLPRLPEGCAERDPSLDIMDLRAPCVAVNSKFRRNVLIVKRNPGSLEAPDSAGEAAMAELASVLDWKHALVVFRPELFEVNGTGPQGAAFRRKTDELIAAVIERLESDKLSNEIKHRSPGTAVGSFDLVATDQVIQRLEADPTVEAVVVD